MLLKLLAVIGLVIAVFIVYQCIAQRLLQVVTMTVDVPGEESFSGELPGTIVVFSDLHNHRFGRDNERLVAAIEAQKPDMILIPGDLIVGRRRNFNVASKLLQKLNQFGIPMYLSLGNHESGTKEYYPELYEEFLTESACQNLHILDNQCEYWSDRVAICGLTLPFEVYGKRGRRHRVTQEDMAKITPAPKDGDFRILLAHTPYYFDTYAEYGANLVLSGHVHGGIVRLPFLGGVISPQMELFPEYDAGLYKKDGTVLALTRGLGSHFPPIRVGNRPELMVLHLERKNR